MQSSDGDCGRDSTTNENGVSVDRRSYLKLAGTAAGAVSLLSGSASAAFERRGIRFERTVNMVTEAGCDPTGTEPCDEQITDAADDHTLLKFPAGEYKITEKNVILNKTNLGFVGMGDVRFTVPERFNEKLLVVDDGTGVLFENIDIDLRAYGATPGLHLGVDDSLQIHDVEFIGQGIHPASIPRGDPGWSPGLGAENGNPAVTNALYPIVRSPDGVGVVTNVVAKNRGLMGTYNAGRGRTGVWVGIATEGTITFTDCQIEEFGNNGCYTSRTYGVVQYEGGMYRNNDINQLRIGSPGSVADRADVVVDATASDSPNPYDALNQRGVRVEMGHNYVPTDVTVSDCDIAIRATPHSGGGVVADHTASQFRVENTRIGVDVDTVRGVLGKYPNGGVYPPPDKPYTGTLHGVSITGTAAGNEAIQLRGRPDSVVEGCCIQQEQGGRDGARFVNANSSEVRNSTIDVPGRQVIEQSCWVATSNIFDNGSCPAPDYDTGDLPHTLSIEGGSGRYSYTFSVSGDLEKRDKADPNDTVSGNTATGQGGDGGIDRYGFSGEILAFDLDGDATVYLDGNRVNPSRFPNNTLTVDGLGSSTEYTFTVSGDLEKTTTESGDSVSRRTASGYVVNWGDSYEFSGEIIALDIDGDAAVFRNGERIDPSRYPDHAIAVDGGGSPTEYTFSVSGDLEKTPESEASDEISRRTASGFVVNWRDSYAFSGELLALDVSDGDSTVFLDGQRVDPDQYLDSVLTIDGLGSSTDYTFTVSGDLEKTTNEPGGRISRGTASGYVVNWGDSYVFSGELLALDIDGEATVYRNGERIDPSRYPDHAIAVDGSGSPTEYTFTVSGNLEKTVESEAGDTVSRRTASGYINSRVDSYTFSGELLALDIDGEAMVYRDGQRVDPDQFLDSVLTIDGTGSRAEYIATAGEALETTTNEPGDTVSGQTASGYVVNWGDSYAFSGGMKRLDIDGDARVFIDGQRIDPNHVLAIDGSGYRAEYTFSVSGDIEKTSGTDTGDTISGRTASGYVVNWRDSYEFSGNITQLVLDSRARLTLNRSNQTITVKGLNQGTTYAFRVSGGVEGITHEPNTRHSDTVRVHSVEGYVRWGSDTYRYSGDLVSLELGGVTVSIEQ